MRALFLEGLNEQQGDLDDAAKRSEKVPSHSEFQGLCTSAIGATPENGSPMHLSVVAAFAIRLKVAVHLIDTDTRTTSSQPSFAKKQEEKWPRREMRTQTTKTAVHYRDLQAAAHFHRILLERYGGQKARCLVLFGAAHFTGVNPEPGGWDQKQDCLGDRLKLDYVQFKY